MVCGRSVVRLVVVASERSVIRVVPVAIAAAHTAFLCLAGGLGSLNSCYILRENKLP